MIAAANQSLRFTGQTRLDRWARENRFLGLAVRYGMSALGPIAISGAHFIASLIFLRELPQVQFGLFSFLLILVPFCMSMTSALLGASVTTTMPHWADVDGPELATHMKMSLVLSAAASALVGGALWLSGASAVSAVLLAVFAGAMTMRWFARAFAYAAKLPGRVVASDLAYGVLLVGTLGSLMLLHRVSEETAAASLAAAAVPALLVFGREYLTHQFRPRAAGSLAAYKPVWLKLTRWSLMGVVLSEITANAHAYVVTFLSGPKAFALLALGSLMMRPASLALTALPDIERPLMARDIAAGRVPAALRTVKEFRTAAAAIWALAIVVAGTVIVLLPDLFHKRGYRPGDVMWVAAIWALIMAVRTLRTPESVLLQAAREYQPLAGASTRSSVISLALTIGLLILAGPVASLLGILAGEIAMTSATLSLVRRWKLAHA